MSDKNYEVVAYTLRSQLENEHRFLVNSDCSSWELAKESKDYVIWSVLRKSDEEIFKIGDLLDGHGDSGIQSINVVTEKDPWLSTGTGFGAPLSNAKKLPQTIKGGDEETVLQEAQRLIYGDRETNYGTVIDNFTRIAQGWSVIMGTEVSAEQVGLAMVWLKVCREINKGTRDNLVDISGYAGCLEKLKKGL